MGKALRVSEVPDMIRFWDWDKNTMDPNTASVRSSENIHWKCSTCGYTWESSSVARFRSKNLCPCHEQNFVIISGVNDILTAVPSIRLDLLQENNPDVVLSTLAPRDKSTLLNFVCHECGNQQQTYASSRVEVKNGTYRFRRCHACYLNDPSRKTMASSDSKLMKYWDFEKNKEENIDANLTSINSKKPVFFHCPNCDYKWSGNIKGFRQGGYHCQHCDSKSPKGAVAGVDDIFTLVPQLMDIYDWDNNTDIDIKNIGITSNKIANWYCKSCNRKWKSSFINRVHKENDGTIRAVMCSSCDSKVKRKVSYDVQYPLLKEYYNEELSGIPLSKVQGKDSSVTKQIWNCPNCNNSFPSSVQSMISSIRSGHTGCPYCSNTALLPGKSFGDMYPEYIREYSSENEIDPFSVFPTSKLKVKWNCIKEPSHPSWKSSFAQRSTGMGGCPICTHNIPIKGATTFADVYPEYLPLWSKENNRKPDDVFFDSSLWFKWNCPDCSGTYGAYIKDVINKTKKCPYCNNIKILPGFNSFAANHPDLLKEWSYIDNYLLVDPDRIGDGYSEPVFWICPKNHIYHMPPVWRIYYQKRNRESCPYCKGLRQKKRHFV